MKYLSLLSIIIGTVSLWGQQPGSIIDFGKYEKKLGPPVIKKNPKTRNYHLINDSKKLDLSTGKVQLSRIFVGDTTSMSKDGYYVEFDPSQINDQTPEFVYYTDYVTNEDWSLFEKYILDSTVRKRLGIGIGNEWLLPVIDENGDTLPLSDWKINWDIGYQFNRLSVDERYEAAIFFYPEHERFNRQLKIDPRKLFFEYYWLDFQEINKKSTPADGQKKGENQAIRSHIDKSRFVIREAVSVYRDSTLWISDSTSLHFGNIADGLVSHYNHHNYYKNYPVCGISQPQARAYLHWLETNHNQFLADHSIPYYVEYELPGIVLPTSKNTAVEIPSFDLNSWAITNQAYKVFIEYVRDSIAYKVLGEELYANDYLQETFNEFGEEVYETARLIDWKAKIDWKRKTGGGSHGPNPYGVLDVLYYPAYNGDTNLIDKRKLIFEYYYYDHKTASIGPLVQPAEDFDCKKYFPECTDKPCKLWQQPIDCFVGCSDFLGKDLDLSYVNQRCEATDVFSHTDRSEFIIKDLIAVYPGLDYRWLNKRCDKYCQQGNVYNYETPCEEYDCDMCPQIDDWENTMPEEYDFDTHPDDLVQGITYDQFRAYWWWWQRERRKVTSGNPAVLDYIPTKKEFEKIQKGETVVHPKEILELPTPTFNYVLKFYKTSYSQTHH